MKFAAWTAVCGLVAAVMVSPAQAQTVDLQAPGAQNFVAPTRILDTRIGLGVPGPIPAHTSVPVTVAPAGQPLGDVDLHVTVVDPGASGHLTMFGAQASTVPTITDVNFTAGVTVSNTVVTEVPQNAVDVLAFYNDSDVAVNVVADYVGFTDQGSQYVAGTFRAINPTRMLSTRTGVGVRAGRVRAGGTVSFEADATPSFEDQPVPEVSAVVLNLSAIDPTAAGHVTAFETGTPMPATSTLNFAAGRTTDNSVIVPLDASGHVSIYNGSRGTVDLTADVAGYYRSIVGTVSQPGTYQSVPAVRAVDTRSHLGSGAVPAHGSVQIQLGGRAGISASRASAVAVNLTAVDPKSGGYLTVWPAGSARPSTVNLNFAAGATAANLALVPLSSGGAIDVYNGSNSAAQILIDVSGYYLNVTPRPANTSTWSGLTLRQPTSQELPWDTVSCAGSGFCATIAGFTVDTFDSQHMLGQYSLDPSTGFPNEGGLISCGTPTFCAAFTTSGESFVFNGTRWTGPLTTHLTGRPLLLSCPAAGFCLAIGQNGAAILTGTTWAAAPALPETLDTSAPYLSCATQTFCMLVDFDGLASEFNGSSWSVPVSMDPSAQFSAGPTAVSCPTAAFCMVMDGSGNAITYQSGVWQNPVNLSDGGDGFSSVSCTSSTFCAAIIGTVETTYTGGTTWSSGQVVDGNYLDYNPISCVSPNLCVIADILQAEIGRF